MCRGRDNLLQQVLDAGGYAYDAAEVAAEIAAAHDRRLQPAPENPALPVPDVVQPEAPPPAEPAAPQQAEPVAPQLVEPQPVEEPVHDAWTLAADFEDMGFERGLVLHALETVGTKGHEAVLEYLFQLCAPSTNCIP